MIVAWLAAQALPAWAKPPAGKAQSTYASPKEATLALFEAVKAKDKEAVLAVLGPEARDILESGDEVADARRMEDFANRMAEGTRIVWENDEKAQLRIGTADWPFPIPLVKQGDLWRFQTAAGRDEILNRRIGKDELDAIESCRAYVEAQREYHRRDRDGDGAVGYAQRLRSTAGKKDGLFWIEGETVAGPLARLASEAKAEGYGEVKPGDKEGSIKPYHGYYFRVLTRQGPHAAAGRFDYMVNGRMLSGFALIAWPSRWGSSGIMTFIVNQDGKVYEKNLGKDTEKAVRAIREFDPDSSWSLVPE
jgi:hypothetical protein